jgi:hypothetical protein
MNPNPTLAAEDAIQGIFSATLGALHNASLFLLWLKNNN